MFKHQFSLLSAANRVIYWCLILLILFFNLQSSSAQSDLRLFVSQPDITQFPLVKFTLRTADSQSIPLPDVDDLSIREDGSPIGDFETSSVAVGIDVIFVLDSNETAAVDDDGRGTRYEKMTQSIVRFSQRFMNTSSLDTVSVIVPDGQNQNGRLLLDAANSAEQIESGLANYSPAFSPTVPLTEMMQLALEQLGRLQSGNRFQAILLMSDASRLPETLDTEPIVAAAQTNNVAIFTAILGAGVTLDEIENAAQLYQPTRGFYVHMPNPEETDPIYLIWQRQSNQTQIRYFSRQRENGRYPITLNIGQASAATEFDLMLAPPEISLLLSDDVINRVGTAFDTPINHLVPTIQPLLVAVDWPDGISRPFSQINLFVNAQPVPVVQTPAIEADQITLEWDISGLETGAYEIWVEVTDSLGKSAATDPRLLSIQTLWPDPPTPTPGPLPTPTPLPTFVDRIQERVNPIGWIGGGLMLLIGLFLLPILLRRQRVKPQSFDDSAQAAQAVQKDPVEHLIRPTAVLVPLTANAAQQVITSENVTIGRQLSDNSIQISDRSVSPLHARIRWQNGRYWLYDEGSSTGTYLNNSRLGLRPLPLDEGDQIRIGRLLYQFSFDVVGDEEE